MPSSAGYAPTPSSQTRAINVAIVLPVCAGNDAVRLLAIGKLKLGNVQLGTNVICFGILHMRS